MSANSSVKPVGGFFGFVCFLDFFCPLIEDCHFFHAGLVGFCEK